MQHLEVECIWSIALNLESVTSSSRFWYNILVFLLLEEKEKKIERAVEFQSSRVVPEYKIRVKSCPAATYFC